MGNDGTAPPYSTVITRSVVASSTPSDKSESYMAMTLSPGLTRLNSLPSRHALCKTVFTCRHR